ncbi:M15 family metallopeptidase [Candidatus Sumerlaeota bacterium]|nr:M15 family metallopeptidase [Candidatus Sumerlaeota bacterium]
MVPLIESAAAKSRLIAFLAIVFSSPFVLAGFGGTDMHPPKMPIPTEDNPVEMILIAEKPTLWEMPNGKRSPVTLTAKAGEHVMAVERVEMGEQGTPWLRIRCAEKDKIREGWLPEALLAILPRVSADQLREIGAEPVDRFHGMPADYVPPDLVPVGHGFEKEVKYKLRRDAAEGLERMIAAAKRDKINLMVVSCYRSYDRQREVYLAKVERAGWDQTTVTKPGHSEHQLGTAVDLTDGNQVTLLEKGFGDRPAGQWLREHAPEF